MSIAADRRIALAGACLAASVVGACGGGARQAAVECAPVPDTVALSAEAAALAGSYDLTMIATSGEASGDTARGTVRLMRSSPEQRGVPGAPPSADTTFRVSHYGSAAIALTRVGALAVGPLEADDEGAPGVLVIERVGQPRTLLLRLGSEANRRDREAAFDGGYTVLLPRAVTSQGFRGAWRSGVGTTNAEGYFCAVRRSS